MTDFGIPIVIDGGSSYTRAGLAGEDTPRKVFPSVVGILSQQGVMVGMDDTRIFCGEEAIKKRVFLFLSYPLEHGIVTNWDRMEMLLEHTFQEELRVNIEEHPVLFTESPLSSYLNREKFTEVLFEVFKPQVGYYSNSQVLALFSQGKTTGVVVDSGNASTHIVPIFKGHVQKGHITRVDIGGRTVNTYLCKILTERGYSFGYSTRIEEYKKMKEKLAYITMDMTYQLSLPEQTHTYTLPDGQNIILGNECYRCPEIIFQPSLVGGERGIHLATNSMIRNCEESLQKYFYNNILFVGGNTMFEGIAERMYKELSLLAPDLSIKVRAPPDRKYSSWIGGAMLASMSDFVNISISHSEYCEYGPSIVFRKCM